MTGPWHGEAVETGGREDRLLPWGRVRDIAGISRTTAWRLQQAGDFPAPVPVSPGRVCWWESELTAWKAARSATRHLKPPSMPRLPGMPRRRPRRIDVEPSAASDGQGGLPLESASRLQDGALDKPPHGRKRRGRSVSVDQLDFNF